MRINTNVAALNAWRSMQATNDAMSKSLERLSSGFRINRASDDAAGLAIAEKMHALSTGLRMAQRNAQDGISLIQTAEGAITETESILKRMRELAVQASSSALSQEGRENMVKEIDALKLELDRIAITTNFNDRHLLNGDLSGAESAGTETLEITDKGTVIGTGLKDIVLADGAAAGTYKFTVEAGGSGEAKITLVDTAVGGDTQTVTVTETELTGLGTGETLSVDFSDLGIKIEIDADAITFDSNTFESSTLDNKEFTVAASEETPTGDGVKLFKLHIGAGATDEEGIVVTINSMKAEDLGSQDAKVSDISFDSEADALEAIKVLDAALSVVTGERASLGALQNRLEHTINNLMVSAENTDAARSRIMDVDIALEMANFTKNQILVQAGTAMLAQANMLPQTVLKLLG